MKRYLATAAALVIFAAAARAGGPPPVYVVVDKVVLEPSASAARTDPDRGELRAPGKRAALRVRQAGPRLHLSEHRTEQGKGMPGRVGEMAEGGRDGQGGQRGACHEAGTFLTTKIHTDDEKVTKPDAAYTTGRRESSVRSTPMATWPAKAPSATSSPSPRPARPSPPTGGE